MSRSVASADDADPLVALGGDDVKDTPRWRGCQRDEVRRVQGVVKVLGKRILHGERGFLEADAVLREVARGLGRIPLEVAMHDRCHEHERTSHAADGEEVVRRSSVGPCRSRADPGLGLEIGMPLGVAVGARRQTIVEASALQVLGLGAHSRLWSRPLPYSSSSSSIRRSARRRVFGSAPACRSARAPSSSATTGSGVMSTDGAPCCSVTLGDPSTRRSAPSSCTERRRVRSAASSSPVRSAN